MTLDRTGHRVPWSEEQAAGLLEVPARDLRKLFGAAARPARRAIQRLRELEHSIGVAEGRVYDRDVGAFLLGPNVDWADRLRRIRYKLDREQ